ncbi:Sulfatase [Lachnospiraceae bacterium TWA4]|nr:Sulfatase [Lachnospiraceae bacterium TWA4]
MSENYGSISRNSQSQGSMSSLVYFSIVFVYLETVFRISMGLGLKYFPIVLLFALSFGCFCSILTNTPYKKFNTIVAVIFTVIPSVLFGVEMVCKTVLSQYYQLLSSADTAAENKLTDYMGAIISGILSKIIGLIFLIIPIIVLIVLLKTKRLTFGRKKVNAMLAMLTAGLVFDILGLLVIRLPWSGDITPKQLYYSDTDVDDQVEQLGILTMLRLDVKHSIFGAKGDTTDVNDFKDMNTVLNNDKAKKETKAEGESAKSNESETTPNVTDTSPNVLNVNLEKLADSAKNKDLKWLDTYFNNVTPTNKNEYTGKFKDYNVIFITAEGFTGYMIDKELTPTLYKLSHEGFVFNNFYTPLHYTSTSGGEFQNLTGLYPKNGNPISMKAIGSGKNNMYFSLAQQFNRLGRKSLGYHANDNDTYDRSHTHTVLGYTWQQGYNGLDMEKTSSGKSLWPQSDKYLIEHSINNYIDTKDPFHVYYMSISGHMPYNFSGDAMAARNKDKVANLKYSDETKAYIAANLELEYGLQSLVNTLEEKGIADKTLIVLAPDHIPYFDVDVIEELAGRKFGSSDLTNLKESDMDFDVYKNTLIMWTASMDKPVKVNKICGQVDILPTISNLLGLEYDSRMIVGTDILSDSTPLVIFTSRSWKTDKGIYNRYTGKFTLAKGVSMSDSEKDEYVTAMKKVVNAKLDASTKIVSTNYYNHVFKDTAIYGKLAKSN